MCTPELSCRVCGNPTVYFDTVINCRNEQLSFKKAPFTIATSDIALYRCEHCKHVQSEFVQDSEYYDEYSPLIGAAQYYGTLYRRENVLRRLYEYTTVGGNCAQNALSYFEIGCGAGDGLKIAEQFFSDVIGIEPSNTAELAERNGHRVIKDYFSEQLGIRDTMQAFSSFQVFKHLESPLPVLRAACNALTPDGVGLINVPNGSLIFQKKLYHQVLCEHINYFSPDSLVTLAVRAGFEILELQSDHDAYELNMFVRKPSTFRDYTANGIGARKIRDRDALINILRHYGHCGVWGAGAKAALFGQLLPHDANIDHFFDSDDRKIGLYSSGIPVPIETPSAETVNACDAILIFAASYTDEILKTLREKYGYRGAVIRFDRHEVVEA